MPVSLAILTAPRPHWDPPRHEIGKGEAVALDHIARSYWHWPPEHRPISYEHVEFAILPAGIDVLG